MPVELPGVLRRAAVGALLVAACAGEAAARERWDRCATVRLAPDAYAPRLHNTLETARSPEALRAYQVEVRLAPATWLTNRCEFDRGGTLRVWLIVKEKGVPLSASLDGVLDLRPQVLRGTVPPGTSRIGTLGQEGNVVMSKAEYVVSDVSELPARVGVPINFYEAFRFLRYRDQSTTSLRDIDQNGAPASQAVEDAPFELEAAIRLEWQPRGGGNPVVWTRSGVPISIDVKDVPVLEFSVVNHPGALAVTRLQCQDLVGTNATTGDDPNDGVSSAYCADNPANSVWMDSVYTTPFGLRLRAAPVPDWAAFGVSAELATAALGESGLFSSAVSDSTEPKLGLVSPVTGLLGVDLRADVGGTELTFQVAAGGMLVRGVADVALRPTVGFNISVPITSVSLARSGEKESP